ncbi:hypothetical protein [Paenibacillus sp. 1P07SE]|uniref:hypothetical protein n=1 Tax=Paenibacillus sp. 1P07SE TaxID=3132209 RepID=UPI0039A66221
MGKKSWICTLLFLFLGTTVAHATPGIYEIWYSEQPTELPYVQGGQVVLQWRDIHIDDDEYDWTPLDELLSELTYPVTLQVNGNRKPDFLFEKIPYKSNWGEVQVRDPEGILMYWHPDYVQHYSAFLLALGDHLAESPYRSNILGVRQNYNAVGTEILNVPVEHRDASTWTVPTGATNGPNWTAARLYNYQKVILDAFIAAFQEGRTDPIRLFVRNNLPDVVLDAQANGKPAGYTYADYFRDGVLSLFHTSSDIEPRTAAIANRFDFFHTFVRPGDTQGFAESHSSAWGDHGQQQTVSWATPPQKNYWRLLGDLHMGISYLAVYSPDLEVAAQGTYKGTNVGGNYKQEFDKAFRFAARYAGFHADPVASPGAWIAFRSSALDLSPSTYQSRVQDYSMHMTLLNPEDTAALDARIDGADVPLVPNRTIEGQRSIGPFHQRFGAWARATTPQKEMLLRLDPDFTVSVNAAAAPRIAVTYLDEGCGTFTAQFGMRSETVKLKNTGGWVTKSWTVTSDFVEDGAGAHIRIAGDATLHMVEISKE